VEVIVDGEHNFTPSEDVADGMALMAELADYLSGQGRAMTGLQLNGEVIPPEQLQDVLSERSISDINVLEVTTHAVADMVTQCLEELQTSLPSLPEACRQLAGVFQSESPEEGYDHFRELAMLWGHIKNRELLVAEYLQMDLSSVELNGRPVHALHEELNTVLQESAQAIKDGDTVLIGDLLEYELAPRAEDEVRIVALLQENAAAQFQS
jgi:hypothetical protein